MGGGDLNLKKSWHPSTLRNIERVWKAEQKHESEQQKIEQLQRELAEERVREDIQTFAEDQGAVKKKDQRLDWMYQGPAAMVNREEYLMGRKIDKTFETLQQIEKGDAKPADEDGDVGSTMFSSQNLAGTATVDLANKIREDPLFSIMKKEKDERKNLLCNPVKMKQLQKLLEASLSDKKSKKHKKNKKKKHQEFDSDDEKLEKKKRKHKRSPSIDSDHDNRNSNYHKEDSRKHQNYPEKHREKNYENRLREPDRRDERYYSSRPKEYKKSVTQPSYYKDRNSSRDNYRYDNYNKDYNRDRRDKEYRKKDDSEEQERRLKEMQENAKWREDQLKKKTKRYQEEDEKEENIARGDASDFIKPMLSKVAGKGSLENRVKQKIFSIQRGSNVMDKNFAKRE